MATGLITLVAVFTAGGLSVTVTPNQAQATTSPPPPTPAEQCGIDFQACADSVTENYYFCAQAASDQQFDCIMDNIPYEECKSLYEGLKSACDEGADTDRFLCQLELDECMDNI